MSGSSVRLCWCIFSSLLVICVSKIRCGIHARYVKCDCDRGDDNDGRAQTTGLSNFVPKALSYSSSERERTLETRFRFFPPQYSTVKTLQPIDLLLWSCTGDYTVDECSETTLILCSPLCLLNGEI